MVNPSDEMQELWNRYQAAETEEEKLDLHYAMEKLAIKEYEEEKKNPPPWGEHMYF